MKQRKLISIKLGTEYKIRMEYFKIQDIVGLSFFIKITPLSLQDEVSLLLKILPML